ncbi:MAG TPA: DUF3574 domain-containing protein [Longimicrobium sp.]|nr:DUF3574 domain-containing protein [Longimicrobium sp.]
MRNRPLFVARRLNAALATCAFTATLAGCANSGLMVGGPGVQVGIPMRRTADVFGDTVADQMFFGRNVPGGGTVSDSAFAAFVDQVVTPRFPNGLTIFHANGQWRGESGAVEREQAVVIEIVHPAGPAAEADLREIADEYKRRFRQEAVLRVTLPAHVRLYE